MLHLLFSSFMFLLSDLGTNYTVYSNCTSLKQECSYQNDGQHCTVTHICIHTCTTVCVSVGKWMYIVHGLEVTYVQILPFSCFDGLPKSTWQICWCCLFYFLVTYLKMCVIPIQKKVYSAGDRNSPNLWKENHLTPN